MENINVHRLVLGVHHQHEPELKQHLQTCTKCETECEELLHTVAILESLPEPIPPPDLIGDIQSKLGEHIQRQQIAFFANPIARLLLTLKFHPHPTFVNFAAMFFYIMVAVFLVKLTFLSGVSESTHVEFRSESMKHDAHIVATSWAAIRGTPAPRDAIEKEQSKEAPIQEK